MTLTTSYVFYGIIMIMISGKRLTVLQIMQISFSVVGIILCLMGMGSFGRMMLEGQEVVVEENDPGTTENGSEAVDESDAVNEDGVAVPSELLDALQTVELASTFKVSVTYDTLQEVVDAWAASYGAGAVAVEIYNVNAQKVVASHRANVQMRPRSLYKLFYLYDAYAQIDAGIDDPNQEYVGGYSLGTCLDVMVRYSNNPCAEAMLGDATRLARVGQLIRRLGLSSTGADGLITSAHDIVVLLQYYYAHPEWSEGSWQKFRDAALNQPYTYRKGLPSGFTMARVYDKAGWGGTTYNDAAMVEFGNGSKYIVAVMTDGVGYAALTDLGRMLERVMIK